MQLPRALALLLALLLTACPGSPGNHLNPSTDAGTGAPDSGSSLAISTSELPAATVSRPYSTTLAASGGSPAYSWRLAEGTLPPGLALSSSGVIAGTPSTTGSATFQVEVLDATGLSARRQLVLEVLGSSFEITTSSALPDAYLGSEYPASLAASGGTPPYTWVLASGALPSGVRLGAEGRFSGSPVASGPFAFTLRVQDSAGLSAQRDFTLSVLAPPAISGATLSPGVVGVAYSAALQASGGKAPLTFRITSGSLPTGLRLESGSVLGTPTAPASASFTVEVQDANDRAASASFQLAIRGGLTVTPTTLPDAYTGAPYGLGLSAAGGLPPYNWSLSSGTLPAGLRLLTSGALDGTPSTPGTASFTVHVIDAAGATDTREVSLTTYAPPSLAAVPPQSAYSGDSVALVFSASQGKPPFLFSSTGTLPPGLTLAPEGLLHGRPGQPGTFAFDVTARDANGRTVSRSVAFTVHAPPAITTTTLPDGTLSAPYSTRLSASGGQGALSWTRTAGALPAGLSLASDGTVSGTPSATGSSTFTAAVTDAGGRAASRTLLILVYAPPAITTTVLTDGYVGTPYSASLGATAGRAPITWSIDSGALPQGLVLAADSGVISGTPGTATSASLTIRVTDSSGRTGTRVLPLTVYRPPSISGPSGPLEGYVSESFTTTYTATDGKPPYTFFAPGFLPEGLQLSSTGTLSGTLTAEGITSSSVRVSDANGSTGSRNLFFTVYDLPAITTASLPEARRATPYSATLTFSGGKAPFTWSRVSGALPSGLTLSASGRIDGTPTGGTASFTARVTDINGRFSERVLTLPVYTPPLVTTASLSDATVGQPYSVTLTASNGRVPLAWSHSGTLPAGLSLSSSGVLSGTPTTAGTHALTVTVRDALDSTDSRTLSLTVRTPGTAFTVGHWNIEWFGSASQGPPNSTSDGGTPDDLQIAHARDILGDAGVNLWGLVEIVDGEDFAALKAQLPGYSGFLANDVSFVPGGSSYYSPGEQKPGILYDSSLTFRGAQLILTTNAADFGQRPPLRVDFDVRVRGTPVPLVVIVLHMKAFEDPTSYGQRQRASTALKNYLDTLLPSERVLVIGDWNDDIDRSITRGDAGTYLTSPFEPFVLDPTRYTFITQPLSLGGERTTVEYREAIDHTLATNEVAAEYVSGTVRVVRPDTWIPDYVNTVSDHYPVVSRYDFGGGGGGGANTGAQLFINELLPNEPSLDGGVGDPDYEFIEVLNASPFPADLSGWSLLDATAERHVFASGTTLAPGRAFVVYGGPRGFPPGTPDTVSASGGQLGLNNSGDTVSLRAPDAGIVDSWTYPSTTDNVSFNRMPDATPDAGFVLHTVLNPGLGSSAGRRADGGTF